MTKFTEKKFSVAMGSDAYRENWERAFGKQRVGAIFDEKGDLRADDTYDTLFLPHAGSPEVAQPDVTTQHQPKCLCAECVESGTGPVLELLNPCARVDDLRTALTSALRFVDTILESRITILPHSGEHTRVRFLAADAAAIMRAALKATE